MADLTSQKLAKERTSATSRQDSAEFGRAFSGLGAYDKIMALQEAAGNRAVDQLLQTDNDGLSSIVEDLSRNRNGQPLDPATREFMERGFGVDFSNVRLHLDNSAAELARGLNARAFTNGNDIFFSSGSHPSNSMNGKAILAHELTHVLQQSTWPQAPGPSASSLEYEKEARQSSERIMDGDSSITSAEIAQNAMLSGAPSGLIQRIGMDDAGYGVPRESRSSLPLESLGLPSEADVAKDDEQMDLYLGREMQAMLEVQENVSLTRTDDPLLEDQLRRLVRLTALGIMAAHRAALIGLRDRTLTSALRAQIAAQPDTVCGGAFATLRDAAWNVDQLEQLRSKLISNRHGLHIARTRVLQSHDDLDVISGLIEEIFGYAQFDTTEERQREIRNSYQSIHYRYGGKQDWEFAWHLADDLIDRRGKQITAVTLSLAKLYEAFPVLHVFGAKNVVGTQLEEINLAEDPGAFEASMYEAQKSGKGYETDQKLLPAVESAFSQILQQVDKVIRAIATDDIDPFDMPEAVRRTNENITPTLEKALQKAVRTHQGKNIVASLGADLAQALIALIPVVGPFIAFGIGAARMGSQLEDMFDRAILADVGANPYADSPLGVNSPSTLEWVMLGVSAVLSAVDLGFAVKGVRSAHAGDAEVPGPREVPSEKLNGPVKSPRNAPPKEGAIGSGGPKSPKPVKRPSQPSGKIRSQGPGNRKTSVKTDIERSPGGKRGPKGSLGTRPFENLNPEPRVASVGATLDQLAQKGYLKNVKQVIGAPTSREAGVKSGDFRFIMNDGTHVSADLLSPESGKLVGNPSALGYKIFTSKTAQQAKIVVVELRGKLTAIDSVQAETAAFKAVTDPGSSIERVIMFKNDHIIADVSR